MIVITHNITPAQDTADYCAILHRGQSIPKTVDSLKYEARSLLVLRARSNQVGERELEISDGKAPHTPELTFNKYFKEKMVKI